MVGLTHLLDLVNQSNQVPLHANFLEDTLGQPEQTDIVKEMELDDHSDTFLS